MSEGRNRNPEALDGKITRVVELPGAAVTLDTEEEQVGPAEVGFLIGLPVVH